MIAWYWMPIGVVVGASVGALFIGMVASGVQEDRCRKCAFARSRTDGDERAQWADGYPRMMK